MSMAVLLEGINIPEGNPITINIYRDGTWVNAYTTEDGNAIEVSEPHGDLIDADKLKETLDYYISEAGWSDEINKALSWVKDEFIDSEQAVIPAEEET